MNSDDMVRKGRQRFGGRSDQRTLSDATIDEILHRHATGNATAVQLAAEYLVKPESVRAWIRGTRRHRHHQSVQLELALTRKHQS